MGGPVPEPDAATTKLENDMVKHQAASTQQLVSKMGKLDLGPKKPQVPVEEDKFPARPAFGTKGTPVTLWANYYRIMTKFPVLYKYTVTVKEVMLETEGSSKSRGKGKQSQPRDVKGRKLHLVFAELLKQLTKKDKSLVLATEFKSQLVSLRKLDLENDNTLRIEVGMADGSDKTDVFDIEIHGPNEIHMNDLLEYLNSTPSKRTPGASGDDQDPAVALDFPKFPEAVDCLNVIFGYGPRSKLDDVSAVGRSRFFTFKNGGITADLNASSRSLIAARGFFQSVRLGTGRLLLNANVTCGTFKVAGKCSDIFRNLNVYATPRSDAGGKRRVNLMSKFLPKTRVWVTMKTSDGKTIRRSKAIFGLAKASHARSFSGANPPRFDANWEYPGPKNVSFYLADQNKYITVFDYYRQKYNFQPQNYPVLNLGTATNPTFVPAEFVEIQPGQAVRAKLTGVETAQMVNFACRSPYANALSITTEGRETLGLDDDMLGKFGIAVDKKLITVQGRVLQAPAVAYLDAKRKETEVRPFGASWNMRNIKVFRSGRPIQRWTFVNIVPDRYPASAGAAEALVAFLNTMDIKVASKMIPPPTLAITAQGFETGSADQFFKWAKGQNIEFILVALGSVDSAIYSTVKMLGDCTYGIHTSCVQGSKLEKGGPGYFANVGLKWNLKAGGVNHKLRNEFGIIKEGKTMVVGYDVTHPTNLPNATSSEVPSLVGLVATIDRDMGQWPSISWEQSSRQEMLDEVLTDAFKSRLELWQKHNKGQLPDNIVIFRDGVSEGQFAQVLQKELPRMRIACNSIYPKNRQPKLTIVVSVKRHQTRFYPTTENNLPSDRNIQNGTVVDRGVTQARFWDFFLTAHASIKGTARPAHYTVLLDEIFRAKYKGEAANELEKFTHELCYLYGRATKAVSICPPAYYADIVCTRARAYRPELLDVSDTDSVVTGGVGSSVGGSKQVHQALKDSMYYI
ncbi:hypothetical protein ACHAPT_000923 [Fusarium lateritium]